MSRIPRHDVPSIEALLELAPHRSDAIGKRDIAVAIHYILASFLNHEAKLQMCDDLLDTHGIESLDPENEGFYDEGIDMCPPFSYCNAGDTYALTLARDHKAHAWVIASWGDLLEEYEQENKLGDYEEFDERPSRCPSCHSGSLKLEHFPNSGRGPSYSWVCESCNHHCFATLDFEPEKEEEEESA